MKYYEAEKKRLVCFKKKEVDKNFWDFHWNTSSQRFKITNYEFSPKSLVCKITKLFLKPNNGPIIEGGCGLGVNVFSLAKLGYNVIGIDNAKLTIENIKNAYPQLNIDYGDVRKLPFQSNFFSGYWSLGVIEHFFKGYSQIILEIKRVLKPKGYLFLTVPYMSPFRKLKSKLHLYKIIQIKIYEKNNKPKNFYQYILEKQIIIKNFELNGFALKFETTEGGIKGFKDEIFFLKFFLKRFFELLYHTYKPTIIRKLKRIIDRAMKKFAAHMIVLVFQKI